MGENYFLLILSENSDGDAVFEVCGRKVNERLFEVGDFGLGGV